MNQEPQWHPLGKIDWDNPNGNWFNIDTRDFHVSSGMANHPDYQILSQFTLIKRFFLTKDELVSLIGNLFTTSGGNAQWRYLSLKGRNPHTQGWLLKYIRIFRTPRGFLFCNSQNKAIPRKDLIDNDHVIGAEVDKSHLYSH